MSVSKRTSEIVTAAATVAAVINARNYSDTGTLQDARYVFEKVRQQYKREVATSAIKSVTASGANAGAFFTAASIADGDVYRLTSTADTTDTAHATAKGSAVVANDVFQRAGAAIQFVGVQADVTGLDAALAETVQPGS